MDMLDNARPTAELARYAATTTYNCLPDGVVAFAKQCILDSVGCSIGGSMIASGAIALELWGDLGGKPESTVFCTGRKVPWLHASYLNAHLANVLDYDDTDIGHPGACIVPAGFAVAEKLGSSGRNLIRAVVLGYEVYRRIAWAIRPSPERYQKVRAYNAQSFGAATVAAVLLGLDESTTTMAFGLAGANSRVPASLRSGHGERPMGWVKNNCGWASLGGVLAAFMAQKGYRATKRILDGDTGFWIMSGSDQCDFQAMTAGLGEDYQILRTSFKPYPCCRFIHSTLDALQAITAKYGVNLAEADSIKVAAFGRLRDMVDYEPASMVDAQFSLPYAVAMLSLGVPPGYNWLTEANLHDPAVLGMGRKVVYEFDPAAEAVFFEKEQYASTVTVRFGGREYTEPCPLPSGGPTRPLTQTQLERKFLEVTTPIIGAETADRLVHKIDRLEELDSVAELWR